MKALTIMNNGVNYRYTDVIKVDDHYLAHLVRDDGTNGKMEHRITQQEYSNGILSESNDKKQL